MSSSVVSVIYICTYIVIENEMSAALAAALTTNSWTSCATESYVTVTAQFLNSECNMKSQILTDVSYIRTAHQHSPS